jgi:hypothetical protein
MVKGESPTGWTAYVRAYKEKHPDVIVDYKELMKQYIKGIRLDETHEGEPV